MKISELDTEGRKNDVKYMFPGAKTGDIALSADTPLVWPAYEAVGK
jgi:hypothetical protein